MERSIFADAAMEPWQQLQQKAQEMLEAAEGQGEEAEQAQLKVGWLAGLWQCDRPAVRWCV